MKKKIAKIFFTISKKTKQDKIGFESSFGARKGQGRKKSTD